MQNYFIFFSIFKYLNFFKNLIMENKKEKILYIKSNLYKTKLKRFQKMN